MNNRQLFPLVGGGLAAFFLLLIVILGMYTVDEGHVGIVKTFGKAVRQDGPGLHFKVPFRDSVEHIDVRPRKAEESMAASTSEQMPVQASVSFNWAVSAEAAIDTYSKYGGLAQFEGRILQPMMRTVAKGAIARFTAEQLIQDRNSVVVEIENGMLDRIARYPGVTVDSVQLENFDMPTAYLEAIQNKQRAKTEADQAEEELRRQNTNSRQLVNTANSERDAEKARADGRAYATQAQAQAEAEAIRLRGAAEAEALKLQAEALKASPEVIEYIRARNWNGQMPQTMLGSESSVLFSLPQNSQ